ncbi:het domain protein [Colletotrichum plurivorum]|uniref:Het domain protein n=1 Tax=Colletotrichum plurivorum TaxID=2175906 RepID=A0A8H6JN67_9PEZI|nr:het domain protein [Colletotrichum plurivorum]
MPVEIDQEVWVLMGSSVPMILDVDKQKDPGESVRGLDGAEYVARRYICQAYVDELMFYPGDVRADLENGRLVAEDVYLT